MSLARMNNQALAQSFAAVTNLQNSIKEDIDQLGNDIKKIKAKVTEKNENERRQIEAEAE